ncbi:polyprenyl synthetase family protein [Candidatus Bathyarchaeota archaeon]|nr:polyprenyl synthetase family protein [Candidatus Bathyarchaeota archaeon]
MPSKAEKGNKTGEETLAYVQELIERKGRKALDQARKMMLENGARIECDAIRKALEYFANSYWGDLARPTLMSLACEAVGVKCEKITPIVVPIILLAGGMDIHDDIIDQSRTKDGRPTVFGKYGKDVALLTGDALLLRGTLNLHRALIQIQPSKAKRVLDIIKETFFEVGDAEALEMRFRGRIDTRPEEYLHVVRKKAADVEAYAHIGALIGDGSKREVEALRKYGRCLGMLAIIDDDLIDLMDKEELENRLRNEVAPLPMLYATQNPEAKISFDSVLLNKKLEKREIKRIIQMVADNGGFTRTDERIRELVKKSLANLQIVRHRRKELESLVYMMASTSNREK